MSLRMKSLAAAGLVCLCAAAWLAPLLTAQDRADVIFHNGKVLTIATDQGDFPIAQAVAIKTGKILAVGSNADVLKLAGPETKKVDLKGKALMPGLINTHKHPDRDALMNYRMYLPDKYKKTVQAAGMIFDWRNKDQVLMEIERIARNADTDPELVVISGRPLIGWVGIGPTLLVNAPPPGWAESRGILEIEYPRLKLTVEELDKASAGRPVMLVLGGGGMLNTKGLAMAKKYFPSGKYNFEDAVTEMLAQPPPEVLAPIYKMEFEEHVASLGYTTASSRFKSHEIATMGVLDQAGEMPIRIGYAPEVRGGVQLSQFDDFVKRLKDTEAKYNSDHLWMTGLSAVPLDGSPDGGGICSSYKRLDGTENNFNFDSHRCYDYNKVADPNLEVLRRLNKLGYRFSNMHSWANLALENALEFYQQLDKDRPLKGRRFAFDHTALLSPKVIELAKQFGIYWSIIPTAFATQRGMLMNQVFGEEVVNAWGFPAKKLVDAGLHPTMEGEFEAADPWRGMRVLVTRKDDLGVVRGIQNAVDRKTALRMMTRWGAEYVLREKNIGSIEPGKFADLIVLNKDLLDPNLSDEDLVTLRVQLTMVGGKVVYRATQFDGQL